MSNIPEYGSMSERKKTAPAGFGVSFSGKDATCNSSISSLSGPWTPMRPKKKKSNWPPGRPEENAENQSSQEQKPKRTQPKPTRWTNFTSTTTSTTSTTSTTTTTSSSRKESTPQSVGPSAKNHHPCQKAKQTPIWDPKQAAFRALGNVASFTVCRLQLNVLYIICFQFYDMSLVMNQVYSSHVTSCHVTSCHVHHYMVVCFGWLCACKKTEDSDTLSYPISQSWAAAYQKGGHANGELDWRLCWCWQRNLICLPATLVSQTASFVMSVTLLTVYCLPLFKCNSAARSWTMLNSVNVSTQDSSHDQRLHSWCQGFTHRKKWANIEWKFSGESGSAWVTMSYFKKEKQKSEWSRLHWLAKWATNWRPSQDTQWSNCGGAYKVSKPKRGIPADSLQGPDCDYASSPGCDCLLDDVFFRRAFPDKDTIS